MGKLFNRWESLFGGASLDNLAKPFANFEEVFITVLSKSAWVFVFSSLNKSKSLLYIRQRPNDNQNNGFTFKQFCSRVGQKCWLESSWLLFFWVAKIIILINFLGKGKSNHWAVPQSIRFYHSIKTTSQEWISNKFQRVVTKTAWRKIGKTVLLLREAKLIWIY